MANRVSWIVCVAAGMTLALATGAVAQDESEPVEPADAPAAAETPSADDEQSAGPEGDGITMELNKLEAADGVCTGFFVLHNGTDGPIAQLEVQLFVFDTDGEISSAYALPFDNIRAGGEKVGVFELTEGDCSEVGRLLVNDIRDCESTPGEALAECSARFSASSRGEVELAY